MTDAEILAACKTHGAKHVYAAAYSAMSGQRDALVRVGLQAANMGDMDRIGRFAFGLLDAKERAADLADVTIKGAKL